MPAHPVAVILVSSGVDGPVTFSEPGCPGVALAVEVVGELEQEFVVCFLIKPQGHQDILGAAGSSPVAPVTDARHPDSLHFVVKIFCQESKHMWVVGGGIV